jgi:hypothetical protein
MNAPESPSALEGLLWLAAETALLPTICLAVGFAIGWWQRGRARAGDKEGA